MSGWKFLDEHCVKLHFHLQGHFADIFVSSIVKNTVVKDKIHILLEIKLIFVGVKGKFTFDSAKVHRVLDDSRIVEQSVGHKINWLVKWMAI